MPLNDIIKEILKSKKMSQTDLAKAMNSTRQNLNNKMSRDNFTIKELFQIVQILDSDILIRERNGLEHIVKYSNDDPE